MQALLNSNDVCTVLFGAFADGGLSCLAGCGLQIDYDKADYMAAKTKVKDPSYEEVLIQLLKDGKAITFKDMEGSEPDAVLTLETATQKLVETIKVNDKAEENVMNIINEEYDAHDAYCALQYALFGELVYG